MTKPLKYLTYCLFIFITLVVNAQNLPKVTPKTPQVNRFRVVSSTNSPTRNIRLPQTALPTNQSRHQNQLSQYEKDRQQVAMREAELKKIKADINKASASRVFYNFPTKSGNPQAEYYYQAFKELNQMDLDSFSLKKATFIIENAYYNNQKSYEDFNKVISNTSKFIEQAIQKQGLNKDSQLAKNLMIYQFMTDTLEVNGREHKPFKYDFNDYMGKENWDNMFVHKLMLEGSGQCNSMPRYYLILAEALNAEAYLSFAPNHSFVRFKDELGEWYNAELTSGAILTDYLMMNSGLIKSETVVNGNYMTSQTKKQVMAQLLNDLVSGYISKFGYDQFVMEIIEKSLQLNPNGMAGNMHKNNYLYNNMVYVARQLQLQTIEDVKRYPKAMEILETLNQQDLKIKNLGFEEMPKEKYEAWLKSMKDYKKIQDDEELMNSIKQQAILKN